MADSVVAGWLAELSLCDLIPTFRDEGVCSRPEAGACRTEAGRQEVRRRSCDYLALIPEIDPILPTRARFRSLIATTEFPDTQVDSVALAGLEDGQLKELGVKRMGDRSKVSLQFASSAYVLDTRI
jgi:hypothetical protein